MENMQSRWEQAIDWRHGHELISAWQVFLRMKNWQELTKRREPIYGNCGIVHELPNYLNRANEGLAIVDMRDILFAEPHYHPGLEIYIVLQGNALVAVGNEKQHVKQDDVVVIPPFFSHYTIPDDECIIACINTPPYTPESYIALKESDASVAFDYDVFVQDIRMGKGSMRKTSVM